jgi:creatinine amidohydrolase
MTRDRVKEIASAAVAVLPTASTEQHGPHLPILTDTLLCDTVVARAASVAAPGSSSRRQIVIAPTLVFGDSIHHRPFPGVLTLPSEVYNSAVASILESLRLSGFHRIAIINGHGGNEAGNDLVARNFAHDSTGLVVAAASYWDIARPALVADSGLASAMIPGHAGQFETALVMAIRPDLVDENGMKRVKKGSDFSGGRFPTRANVRVSGAFVDGGGYTDDPGAATADDGRRYLEIITAEVAALLSELAAT